MHVHAVLFWYGSVLSHHLGETPATDELHASDSRRAEPRQLRAHEAHGRPNRDALSTNCRQFPAYRLNLAGDPVDERGPVAAGDPQLLDTRRQQAASPADLQATLIGLRIHYPDTRGSDNQVIDVGLGQRAVVPARSTVVQQEQSRIVESLELGGDSSLTCAADGPGALMCWLTRQGQEEASESWVLGADPLLAGYRTTLVLAKGRFARASRVGLWRE